MGDVGHHHAFGRINWSLWCENAVDAEGLHEPALFILGLVAGTGHRASMAHGTRQLRLPTADHARYDWLAEFETVLVITAGFGIKDRRLAARIVLKRVNKISCRVMDIDVLAWRYQSCGTPPFGRQILGE